MEVIIEQTTRGDISQIIEIDKEAFGKDGVSEEMIKSQLEIFPKGLIVAKEESKIAGVICCERHKKEKFPPYSHNLIDTHRENGNLLYLSVITVAKDFRGKGIGSLLLDKVFKLAKEWRIGKIYLPVNKKHPYLEKGVMQFWKKNGYEITGETNWEFAPQKTLDSYIFSKIILNN